MSEHRPNRPVNHRQRPSTIALLVLGIAVLLKVPGLAAALLSPWVLVPTFLAVALWRGTELLRPRPTRH